MSTKKIISGFNFTKFVVIQSLEAHEIKTGDYIAGYIQGQINDSSLNLKVEKLDCGSAAEFIEIIDRLNHEANSLGEIPVLHVECHGDSKNGLEFENGSCISWDELANELLRLNVSCNFNLLAVFSACFGGYFLQQIDPRKPSPCWCMIAPTEKVDPGEIMGGFMTFYSNFFSLLDLGKAVASMAKLNLSYGRWFGQTAELWFERIIISHIETHCTKEAVGKRARKLYRRLRSQGKHRSVGNIKRRLTELNRKKLLYEFFDRFFMTDRLPQNTVRFFETRRRLEVQYRKFKESGDYFL